MKIGKAPNPFQFQQAGQKAPVQKTATPQANPFQQGLHVGKSAAPPVDQLGAFKQQIAGGGVSPNLNQPRPNEGMGTRLLAFG